MTRRRNRAGLALAIAATFGVGLLASAGNARAQVHHDDYYDDGYGYGHSDYGYDPRDSHGGVMYDRDGDGVMDPGEWLTMQFDRNHDGVLDRRERAERDRYVYGNPDYRQRHHRHGVQMWSDWDGRRGWNDSSHQRHLSEHDVNRDGILDRRELRALHRHDDLEELFGYYDRNGDGVLSRRETLRTPLRNLIGAADHEGDGFVTWDELDHYLADPGAHQPAYRPAYRRSVQPVYRRTVVPRRPSYRYEFRLGF